MRKLKLFFACLLMAVLSIGQVWAGQVTISPSQALNDGGVSPISVACAKGTGTSNPAISGGQLRLYQAASGKTTGNTISFSSEKTITSIVFTFANNMTASNGSFSEGSYDGTDTWTGSTNSLTLTVTGTTSGTRIYITNMVVTYDDGGSTKTLSSVTVSGAPTKTAYYEGEDFDPAGLVVTGTYDDKSQTAITSGITWSYNPSQTLALNQTSIGVTATVGEVSSEEYNVTGLTVIEAPTTVTFAYEDYKTKGGPSGSGSSYTMEKTQVSIGSTTFYGNNSYAHFYAGGTITVTPAAGVTITQIVLTASAENYNGYQSSGTITVSAGSMSHDGVILTWTGSADEAFTISHNKQIRWTSIVVFYEQGEAPAVDKPTISGETPFLGSTTVTITHADADHIYYTTNGDEPTIDDNLLYSDPFSLTNTATVKAIAVKGGVSSAIAEKAFTKATVLTVAQARAAIDAGGDLSNKYVAGIISQIDSYQSNYHSITYWISDDGTTTDQLEVYSGLAGVVKEQFTSLDDLAVGDDVTVKGTLKKYNSIYEFDYNNTVVAYKPIARLAWSAASYNADIDNPTSNVYPTLTNTNGVAVAYSSTNENAATIDAANGEITLVAVGSTTIKATFAGNDSYKANSASYTLNVASSLVQATISFDVDGGDAIEPLTDKQAVVLSELPAATKAGKNFGGWFKDENKTNPAVAEALEGDITLYAKWLEPYTVTEAKAVIDAAPAGTANQYVAGIISKIDSYNSTYKSITYWISADGTTTNQLKVYGGLIGNATTALDKDAFSSKEDLQLGDEVVIVGTLKDYNSTYEFDKDNMIYSFSRKASAGLAYAETAVEKTVGDDAFINPLTNPNSVAVSYGTSDDQVAEVANDGTVTINGEGSAIITATFAGNDQYKAASVSYAITVSAAVVHGSITYVENGAKEDIANVDDATALPDPLPTVTKDNFIFDGWWTTSTFEAGSKAVAGAALTGDVILYAKWNAIPYYATVYTSNVPFVGGGSSYEASSKVIIANTEYDAQKVGASSKTGTVTVTVPAKTHTLHFHAFTWKNKSNVISISGVTNPSATTFDVIGDDGGGASSPYTIAGNPINHYYSVTFDDVTEETEITFSYSDGEDKRFIMYGINQEGGVLPVLDHIVITGEATELTYEAGDVFNPAGLGVNAIYTLESVEQTPVPVDPADIEWSFDPAHIAAATTSVNVTATYSGKSANKEVTGLTVTVPATPEILATPAAIDFGTVYQNAIVDAQGISVTLKAVDAATVTLDGEGFSIDKAALSELNSTINVTPATTVAGTFAATVTISDDAGVAADVVINLSMKVEAVEDLSGTWVKATSVAAGDRIIIGATVSGVTKTMGAKNTNNRAAVVSTYEDLVLTPAEGTKTFLVVDAGEGKFALQALNGNYLTSATSGTGNNLWEAENYDLNNAKWTITIDGEGVASVVAAAGSKTDLQYNNGNNIFSCYSAGGQKPINIYKKGTPDYGSYQRTVTAGNYGTICLPKAGVISGATLFEIADYDGSMIYVDEILSGEMEAGKPYIFQATSEQLNVVYTSSVAEETAGHANGLYGFYNLENENAQYDIAQDAGNYILYQNAYWLVKGRAAYIANYRAYIKLNQINNTGNQAPGRRRVAMAVNGEQVATGFENIDATEKPVKLMLNGQIYILRGEKLYDATGRLVK